MLYFRFYVRLPDGQFSTYHNDPSGWTHVVLNYIGPNNGEGIRIYFNEAEVKSDTTKSAVFQIQMEMVGLLLEKHDYDQKYASVQVDELIFFNKNLTDSNIQTIYNKV